MRAARLAGLLAVGLLALLAVPTFASASVPAHPFKEIFGSAAQPEISEELSGITVDQASGEVYVINLEEHTLLRYKENGEPAPFSALSGKNVIDGASGEDETPQGEILGTAGYPSEAEVAVAPASAGETAGDIYVTDASNKVIDIFASSGKYLGQQSFGYPCGVAVDSAGTVFVGSKQGEAAVYKLKPTSPGHLSEVAQFPTTTPCQVAAGAGPTAGSIFVAALRHNVTKLNAETGAVLYTVFSGSESGELSVDPATGHLYVTAEENQVKEFDASGVAPVEVSSTALSYFVRGVGADSASGGFYASEEEVLTLEVFGPLPPLHTVTVAVSGEGEVSETAGSPAPASGEISGCEESAGNCSAEYYEGEEPELEATAATNNEFVKWTVEHAASTTCTGATTPCTIEVGSEDVTAAAEFALSGFPLTIEKEGPGTVTVASLQSGLGFEPIDCGTHCSELFAPATVVELTATPEASSAFTGWSTTAGDPGSCTGMTSPCLVTIGEAVTLKATSTQLEALTVSESGPGSVECEFAHSGTPGACTSPQPYGTFVKVVATAGAGAEVSSLSGTGSASSCSTSGCEFTISEASTVSVEFELESESLAVSESGPGSVECEFGHSGTPGACSSPQPYGIFVKVIAVPNLGAELSSLSGTGSASGCSASPCEFTIGEASTVDVEFTSESESLSVSESGPGSVECEFAHSVGACTGPQPYGTLVTVKATPSGGAELSSLSGTGSANACSTSGCEFDIKEASSVTVEFVAITNPSTLTVFKAGNGKGTVTSLAPHTGISCGVSCEEASASFEEGQTVELEETPQAGSVFAGWLGCRQVSGHPTKCTVDLKSEEAEVTAVFLIEGKEGPAGKEGKEGPAGKEGKEGPAGKEGKEGSAGKEGKEGPAGKEGKEGPAGKEGKEGPAGKEGLEGKAGKEGSEGEAGERGQIGLMGEQGPAGATGANGAQGPQGNAGAQGAGGPAGAPGATGSQGPKGEAGPAAKVTCKIEQHGKKHGKKIKVTCTVTYATQAKSSAVHHTLRWVLVGHGHVVAHGASKGASRIHLGDLHQGRYVLYLAGSHHGTVIHVR